MRENRKYRGWDKIIQLIGGGLILVGIFAAMVGPLEVYTYYLFSSGGKFHYAGFEFGSFMFANITIQVAGYYAIALVCIPLGYGHLKLHRWSRKIALTILWDWLVLGLPLSVILFLMLLTSKDLPPGSLPLLGLAFVVIYPVLPGLLIKFYRSANVRHAFQHKDGDEGWFEQTPQAVLVLGSLMIFFIGALHIPLLFNGIFPVFGIFSFGLEGVLLIDLSVFLLIVLTWGVLGKRRWAWWGSVAYFVLMILSTTITFLKIHPKDILAQMKFAQFEQNILKNVPVQGINFVVLIVLPLVITLVILITSRKYFQSNKIELSM